MAIPVPIEPTAAQALAMQARFGPNAGLAFQRSQYLAQALQSLENDARENTRTPAALGANLLASAIMQWGKHRADVNAMQAYQADIADQNKALRAHTPLDTSAPAAAPPAPAPGADASGPAGPSPAAPPEPAAPQQSAPVVPASASTPMLSDADRMNLARMVYGEARGEPAVGQEAVASVALNRLKRDPTKTLTDVLMAPHQFAGMNGVAASATPSQLAPILANIAPALQGQDPTGGADHFYNPALANPAWGQGPGQMIGHHRFMALDGPAPAQMAANGPQGVSIPPPGANQPIPGGPQLSPQQQADAVMAAHQLAPGVMMGGGDPGHPPQAPQLPGGGSLAYVPPGIAQNAPVPPPQGGPAPYQVASNGPTPPPPQQPVPPPSLPAQQGPAPVPVPPPAGAGALAQGIPHQLVTPEEWQQANALLSDPRTRDLGIQEMLKLKMRAAAPVEMKPGTYWGEDGKPHAVEQFSDRPGIRNAFVQQSNLDNHVTVQSNPAYGAVPGGMVMGQGASLSKVPTQQEAPFRMPGVLGLYVHDDKGNPVKVADDAITPKDLQTSRDSWRNSDEVKKAFEGIEAYNGIASAVHKMAGNNGVVSTAAVDSYLRGINPGMGARNTTVNMFLNHLGFPTELQSWVQSNIPGGGGGYLTPATFNQMLSVIRSYAGAHAEVAQGLADRDLKAFQNYGVPVTPEMLGEALTPFAPPPQVKWLNEGSAAPAAKPPFNLSRAPTAQEIQAEIARRKAAGHMK